MTRTIEHRSTSPHPASEVYAVMTDPDYLKARLEQLGGPGAALLEHEAGADGARYRVRHGLDSRALPQIVRNLLAGDLVIERTETWTRREPGRYSGDVDVLIKGTPASASGGTQLHDVATGGSELVVRAEARVDVPLLGNSIEGVIAEQVTRLLEHETAFTAEWIARR